MSFCEEMAGDVFLHPYEGAERKIEIVGSDRGQRSGARLPMATVDRPCSGVRRSSREEGIGFIAE